MSDHACVAAAVERGRPAPQVWAHYIKEGVYELNHRIREEIRDDCAQHLNAIAAGAQHLNAIGAAAEHHVGD